MDSVTENVSTPIKDYSVWLSNESFGVATSSFLLICGFILIWNVLRGFLNGLQKRLDSINDSLNGFHDLKDKAVTASAEREARIIAALNSHHDKVVDILSKQGEKTASLLTAINIMIKKEIDGEIDDDKGS